MFRTMEKENKFIFFIRA